MGEHQDIKIWDILSLFLLISAGFGVEHIQDPLRTRMKVPLATAMLLIETLRYINPSLTIFLKNHR